MSVWDNPVGLLLAVALAVLLACLIAQAGFSYRFKLFLVIALGMRVAGSFLRYYFYSQVYGGGDATRYYQVGLAYSERFSQLDFSPLWDPALWHRATWYGTQFVYFVSGFVLSVIGPTILGDFVVFSLIGFVGIYFFARAFQTALPQVPAWRYLRWLALFPSIWYWPASLGKDALMLAGLGMATYGIVGLRAPAKVVGVLGLALIFSVRPQVAAVAIFCYVAAHWISSTKRWGIIRLAQGFVLLGAGLVALGVSLQFAGVEQFDAEGLTEYMEIETGRSLGGGSGFDAVSISIFGAPLGLVNTLFRPFPWDVNNMNLLLAFVETWLLWGFVFLRRRRVFEAIRTVWSSTFVAFAVCFVLMYSTLLGMMLSNVGILARQRTLIFPLLFVLLEAVPRRVAVSHVTSRGQHPPFARSQMEAPV